eukprot:TRINITY_DN64980_c0_g1_i1.p1 TRINITY_DN64980_c0_g1~~TRINITY_DN64980_c0_g1_i1.p1  ORF type:complete len:633 (+),score=186.48 TRINITY_DN64980_c0_g1_i1:83-1981(+)
MASSSEDSQIDTSSEEDGSESPGYRPTAKPKAKANLGLANRQPLPLQASSDEDSDASSAASSSSSKRPSPQASLGEGGSKTTTPARSQADREHRAPLTLGVGRSSASSRSSSASSASGQAAARTEHLGDPNPGPGDSSGILERSSIGSEADSSFAGSPVGRSPEHAHGPAHARPLVVEQPTGFNSGNEALLAELRQKQLRAAEEEDERRRAAEEERRLHEEREAARLEQERLLLRRRQEEEERRRRAEEEERRMQVLRSKEASLWAALAPAEASRLRSLLQAVSLYQQQLNENERIISDLEGETADREAAMRSLRRRIQISEQGARNASESQARSIEEVTRWEKKRESHVSGAKDFDLAGLRGKVAAASAESQELQTVLGSSREEVHVLRSELSCREESGREQAHKLTALRNQCHQLVVKMKAEHVEEIAHLRAEQTEELARLEAQHQTQMATIRAQHAEETSRNRCGIKDAVQRKERQRFERDEVYEQLAAKQKEGQQLQQQLTEAREAVLDLSNQLKAVPVHPLVASQLGLSLDASMASMSFQFQFPEDHYLEGELVSSRQLCRSLERECARTHDLLEKKQAECERWRQRVVDSKGVAISHDSSRTALPPLTLGPRGEEAAPEEDDASLP